jgi:hypothetical protein
MRCVHALGPRATDAALAPTSHASQLTFRWDGGGAFATCQDILLAGQVIQIDPEAGAGATLYAAIGSTNLTALTGQPLNNDKTGSGGSSTSNA